MAFTPQPIRANPGLPSFEILLSHYPKIRDGATVKRMIGGSIDDTNKPAGQQWLGGEGGDTCTIRMSLALNKSGRSMPANPPGMRTTRGGDGNNYAFAVQEMRKYLTVKFGPPGIDIRGTPVSREPFVRAKGIILFDITFGINPDNRTRALGHVDLWDSQTFFDEKWGISRPGRDFFQIANRVSLWVASGTGFI
jgi:Type VI secretion system (T6SS), amidase effector protein 4